MVSPNLAADLLSMAQVLASFVGKPTSSKQRPEALNDPLPPFVQPATSDRRAAPQYQSQSHPDGYNSGTKRSFADVEPSWDSMSDATAGKLAKFIETNGLDERCIKNMMTLDEDQLLWVMDKEFEVIVDPRRGTASALVSGRCRQAKAAVPSSSRQRGHSSAHMDPSVSSMEGVAPAPWDAESAAHHETELQRYFETNGLDERCVSVVRSLSVEQQKRLMEIEFVVQIDETKGSASALIVGRCKKVKAQFPGSNQSDSYQYKTSRLEEFIEVNGLDARCVESLRNLSENQQNWVVDQEFKCQVDPSRGSASALVIGRIRKARNTIPAESSSRWPRHDTRHSASIVPPGGSHSSSGLTASYAAPVGSARSSSRDSAPFRPVSKLPARREADDHAYRQWSGAAISSQTSLRLEDFIHVNTLDERACAALWRLSDEEATWVMDREFVVQFDPQKGTASNLVCGRCRKAKDEAAGAALQHRSHDRSGAHQTSDTARRVEEYIRMNGLDDRCSDALRKLTDSQAHQVMDIEFVVTVDTTKGSASALVVGRIKRAKGITTEGRRDRDGDRSGVPPALAFATTEERLEEYISINNLDEKCTRNLICLTEEQAKYVIDQEFVVKVDPSRGTASSLVSGRCRRAEQLYP